MADQLLQQAGYPPHLGTPTDQHQTHPIGQDHNPAVLDQDHDPAVLDQDQNPAVMDQDHAPAVMDQDPTDLDHQQDTRPVLGPFRSDIRSYRTGYGHPYTRPRDTSRPPTTTMTSGPRAGPPSTP